MSKPQLYLFIGAPGSGKTTIANLIHETTGAVHLWADHERQAMFERVTHSKAESNQLYTSLNDKTEKILAAGQSAVFDTNFNYRKDRDYLRQIAAKYDAKTVIIWLQTPIAIARERALHSHHSDRNGYDTTMSALEFDRLVDHLEPPTDNEHFITIDGSNIDPAAVLRQLGL